MEETNQCAWRGILIVLHTLDLLELPTMDERPTLGPLATLQRSSF